MVDGLVSVIMPSWNTAEYIGESIESVINQTYSNWELLIVDDCSTDNTDEIVGQYLSDNRIKYFHNQINSGAALTRNFALREAQGEWIAFLDSDDIWLPDKLEKQIKFMKTNNYILSYTEYEKVDINSKPLNIHVSGPKVVNKRRIYNYDYIGQLTMMYSYKAFGTIQINDIKKNNDYAIRLKLFAEDDVKAYLLEESLARYRIREKSISHDKLFKKIKSHYVLFRFCDEQPVHLALWFTCWNMWFGIIKKMKYEKELIEVGNEL